MEKLSVTHIRDFLMRMPTQQRRELFHEIEQEIAKCSPHPRGTLLHNAKLNENSVRDIRRCAYKVSQRKMAQKYGVSLETIKSVIKGFTWTHVR